MQHDHFQRLNAIIGGYAWVLSADDVTLRFDSNADVQPAVRALGQAGVFPHSVSIVRQTVRLPEDWMDRLPPQQRGN